MLKMNLMHRIISKLPLLLVVVSFASCRSVSHTVSSADPMLQPLAFVQHSAEYKALCYQAYNTARFRLDEILKEAHEKPLAIVVDIDETVLDNYPVDAKAVINGTSFSEYWDTWVDMGVAQAVPGALDFLQYAAQHNVQVFYISNREEKGDEATLRNLKELGFPDADKQHLMLMGESTAKQPRRDIVLQDFDIVLLCGDNLADFATVFESDDQATRNKAVVDLQADFGTRWIVLPNPVYGKWKSALLQHKAARVDEVDYMKAKLKDY